MKTFKVLEKPSGIAGIQFEELGFVLALTLTAFFLINLLGIWWQIPGWLYLLTLVSIVAMLVIIKKSNRQGRPQYLLSRIAWWRSPRKLYLHKPNYLLYDPYQPNEKKQVETRP